MTSKIRIIGTFGEDVLDDVTALADKIGNVQYVSLLVDGEEKLTDSAPESGSLPMPEETVEAGTTEAPAPATPPAPPASGSTEPQAEGAEQPQPEGVATS